MKVITKSRLLRGFDSKYEGLTYKILLYNTGPTSKSKSMCIGCSLRRKQSIQSAAKLMSLTRSHVFCQKATNLRIQAEISVCRLIDISTTYFQLLLSIIIIQKKNKIKGKNNIVLAGTFCFPFLLMATRQFDNLFGQLFFIFCSNICSKLSF